MSTTECMTVEFKGAGYMRRVRVHNLRALGYSVTRRTNVKPCPLDRDCVRGDHQRIKA